MGSDGATVREVRAVKQTQKSVNGRDGGCGRKALALALDRKGTTMVEVLVAFIVVMIMLLLFTRIVTVSAGMLRRSQETINRSETFNANYYKLENAGRFQNAGEGIEYTLVRTDAEGNELGEAPVKLDHIILQKMTDAESGMSRFKFAPEE